MRRSVQSGGPGPLLGTTLLTFESLSDPGSGSLILCPSVPGERWGSLSVRVGFGKSRLDVEVLLETFLRILFPVMRQRRLYSVFLRGELLSSRSRSLKQTGQGSSCAELGFKGTGATQHSTHTHTNQDRGVHTHTHRRTRPPARP